MGQALGGVVSAIGAQVEAEAAKNAAKFNARVSAMEAADEEYRVRKAGRQQASTNVTRVAKSGVRLEGSPLEVMAENASNVERQVHAIERQNYINQVSAQAQIKAARTSAKLAIAGSVVNTIGSVASLGLGGAFGGGGGAAAGAAAGSSPGGTGVGAGAGLGGGRTQALGAS